MLAVLSGPVDKLKTAQTVLDPNLLFGPQAPFATPAVDGYTAVGQEVPPAAIIFGTIALHTTNMLRTLRSKLRSQSSARHSSRVP